ncbi:hypothetical protein FN846DRAFT_895250 [Sphaerosporella brunnea]|uniref:Uncharacterized protein n=1 Tax=Sphaerosporella brunnea TaxID=1250544 RepID=A0A5J5EEZ8_9PEZI|nr:hypothetical protein FN846DRAFT_895250 [Sphaerosporella brunnea]
MSDMEISHALPAASSSADPDADATVREFIDCMQPQPFAPASSLLLGLTSHTEYLPSDINRYLWRLRDLRTRHDESRAQLGDHLKSFAGVNRRASAKLSAFSDDDTRSASHGGSSGSSSSSNNNDANGLHSVVDSVSDKEMELRLLISQCLNDACHSVKESAVEAKRLEEHVERHHSRIVAIQGKLNTITIPSRDPTPEETRPPKPKLEDQPVRRITLRFGNVDSASPQPPSSLSRSRGRPTVGRTPARRAPKTSISALAAAGDDDEGGWEDMLDTAGMKPLKKKKGFAIKRGPKHPPADPLLSGGARARYEDGTLIPNDKLPWNQLTNEELARLRKRMKKNSAWTPSVTMIVRELEALGRGPNNRGRFREQWEGKEEVFIGPEEGGIGDPQKILPDDSAGARENKGMRLNRAKKRKREEEKKERAREAERSGLDPVENERKHQEEEQERQRKENQAKRRKKKEEEEETAQATKEHADTEAADRVAQEEEADREDTLAEAAALDQTKQEVTAVRNEEFETEVEVEVEAEAKTEPELEPELKPEPEVEDGAGAETQAEAEAKEAAKEKAEQEHQEQASREKVAKEKAAKEKAAKEKAAIEDSKIITEAEPTAAAKPNPAESDDELSDVPDIEEPSAILNSNIGEAPSKPPNRASKRTSVRPPSRPPRGISATPRPKRNAAISHAPTAASPPPTAVTTRKRSQSVTPARSATSTKASAGKKPANSKRPTAGARRRKRGGGGGETVDTNEEADEDLNKYCLCDEISRGTMVACENEDVSFSQDVAPDQPS